MADNLKTTETLKKVRAVFSAFSDGLEDIRGQIDDLKSERDDIERQPVDEASAQARAALWVSRVIADAMEKAPSPQRFSIAPSNWKLPDAGNINAVITAYQGEALAAAVKQEISDLYATQRGLSDQQRASALADVDRKLFELELAEESLIRGAEASNIPVSRRADADPRAVLAHQSVMP